MSVWSILLFISAGGLITFVIVKVWGASKIGKTLREFRRLGFVDAERRDEREGLVTLVGRAESESDFVAPFSGRDCIGYAVDIFDSGQSVESFDGEPPVFSAYGVASFTLATDAERVSVSAGDEVILLLAPREDPTFVTTENLSQYLPAFERIGLSGVSASRGLRVRERLVLSGDRVVVRGEATRAQGQLQLSPGHGQPLLVMRGEPRAIAEDITFSGSPIVERLRSTK